MPNGDYLFRPEHVAVHLTNAPQLYMSCAQITITGGGSGIPGPLVSFPGAYKADDPAFTYDMNNLENVSVENPRRGVY